MEALALQLGESSWRCLPVLLLVVAALAAGRATPACAHRLWGLACAAMLSLPPLLAAPPLETWLPSRFGLPAEALLAAPGATAAEPWRRVEYRPPARPWLAAVGIGYVAGAAVSTGWLIAGVVLVSRRRRRAEQLPRALARDLLPPGCAPVLVSREVDTPAVVGWWRPAVLLPPTVAGWSVERLRAVLAHELAHCRRRDGLWMLLARLNRAVFWFHPAAWWLERRLALLAELVADEAGAAAVGRRAYARCLAAIAGLEPPAGSRLGGAPSLATPMARRTTLPRRLRHLAAARRTVPRQGWRWATAVPSLILAAAALLPWSPVLPPSAGFAREVARTRSVAAPERAAALYRVARWPGQAPRAVPVLLAHLGDDAPIDVMPAWSFAGERWAPALSSWRHPSPGEVAALGLASLSRRAAPALEQALLASDPVVRRHAAWALGELRHPRGVSERGVRRLLAALADPDAEVRAAAAWALGDLGEQRAVPALRAVLASDREGDHDALYRTVLATLERGHGLEYLRHGTS